MAGVRRKSPYCRVHTFRFGMDRHPHLSAGIWRGIVAPGILGRRPRPKRPPSMLTGRRAAIECCLSAARRGGTFHFGRLSFRTIAGSCMSGRMSGAQISHLLPTYARVDLAFERGEGVWLVATD